MVLKKHQHRRNDAVLLKTLLRLGALSVVLTCLYCRYCVLGEEFLFMSWLLQSPAPVCFHLQHLDDAEEKEKPSAST